MTNYTYKNHLCDVFYSYGHQCRIFRPFPIVAFSDISLMIQDTYRANMPVDIYLGINVSEVYPDKERFNIVYQLEQLDESVPRWTTDEYFSRLGQFNEIWEYDSGNVEFLKSRGIAVRYKPLQYAETLELANPYAFKDIDVLFVGSINDRRKAILDKIRKLGINLLVVSSSQSPELIYNYISRAKIILNLHYYPCNIQEQCRILPLVVNNKYVLSEPSRKNYFEGFITEMESSEMPTKISQFLNSGSWNLPITSSREYKKKSKYLND